MEAVRLNLESSTCFFPFLHQAIRSEQSYLATHVLYLVHVCTPPN